MAGSPDVGRFLLAHGRRAIWAHSQAVAAEAVALAERLGLDQATCRTAALCHDLGGIWTAARQLDTARRRGWTLDPAEERYPFLLHQRFSAVFCREKLGIENAAILSAVGHHTTLRAEANPVDMVIYLADKLAWDQPGAPPYAAAVRTALEGSLAAACLTHIAYSLDHGMILLPHRWLLEARAWLQKQCR